MPLSFHHFVMVCVAFLVAAFEHDLQAQAYGGRARAGSFNTPVFRSTFDSSLSFRPIIRVPSTSSVRNPQSTQAKKRGFSLIPNFRKNLRYSLRGPVQTSFGTAKNPVDRAIQITIAQTNNQLPNSFPSPFVSSKNLRQTTLWPTFSNPPDPMVWVFNTDTANAYHIDSSCRVFSNPRNTTHAITSVPLRSVTTDISKSNLIKPSRRPCLICSKAFLNFSTITPHHGLN
jgi:hypothetical protein